MVFYDKRLHLKNVIEQSLQTFFVLLFFNVFIILFVTACTVAINTIDTFFHVRKVEAVTFYCVLKDTVFSLLFREATPK